MTPTSKFPEPVFQVGDRVSREIDLGTPLRRYGTIARIETSRPNVHGDFDYLYFVDWDDASVVSLGYLASGLVKETRTDAKTP